ncbi:MAG: hypothetical protein EOO54_25480 [Haliea sp.]|nr:MAG: hypothetical protein EOO54_25480 [Haliea sp.]
MSDLPRQQMAMATQATCAMFRGFEAMRKTQEQAAHRALTRHAAVAEKLQQPCSPADLLALQTELLRFDVEGATLYWQQLQAAAQAMQADMLASTVQGPAAETTRKTAAALGGFPAVAAVFGNNGFNARAEAS